MTKHDACKGCPKDEDCESEQLYVNCCAIGNHPYADWPCEKCGKSFCYDCCTGFWNNTNDDGKNHMRCPNCGHTNEI